MTNDKATIREVYSLVDEMKKESAENSKQIMEMFERFQKDEFSPLKEQVQKLWTYGGVLVVGLSIIGSIAVDWVRKNILHL